MGLGALGTGLLGALGGAAGSFSDSMGKKIEREDRMAELEGIERFKEKMLIEREARLKEAKIAENKAVMGRAGEMANAERGTQMDQAAEIYRKSGMSEADIAAGIGATETARAEKVAPTREHMMTARGEMGLLSSGEIVADIDKREATEYARGRDATSDEFKREDDKRQQTNSDRSYALDKQRLAISAAAANAAQNDRNVAKKDKAELASAYEQYAIVMAQEHTNPGSTGQQGASWAIKIKSLGGDPASIETALFGPTQKSKVTTTEYVGGNEVKTERNVVERVSNHNKLKAQPTAADITATAKKYNMTEQQVKDKLGIK